jgi:uncharacterized protein YciI
MRRILLLTLLLSTAALAQPAQTRQFLLKYEPVRADFTLQNMTEAERPVVMEHGAYLKSLTDQGKLILGGQVFDPKGLWGIVIVTAPDAEAANAMLQADPSVKAKIFRGDVIPFRVAFLRPPEATPKP